MLITSFGIIFVNFLFSIAGQEWNSGSFPAKPVTVTVNNS